MSSPGTHDTLIDRLAEIADPWVAIVGAALPEGTKRHPMMFYFIEHELGRVCVTDEEDEGVRLGFPIEGDSARELRADFGIVTLRLLEITGLEPDAIYEDRVFHISVAEPPKLTIVPNIS